jgi:LCP family protein required for cell wall assembly
MTKSLSSVLGTDIYYYISIDFDGFINIIDELGGIDINVENTFDDYSFPIRGEEDNPDYYARFEHLHFDQGWQHMDGALALKYARSRHASGLEGSDFARAKRQQLILEAVKTKLLSRHTLLKPAMLSRIISELNHNVKTNLDVWALIKLWNDYKDIDRSQISNKVLNDGPNGLLMASRGENDAYILIPQTGNFKVIQNFVQNIFDENTNITTQNNQSEATKTPLESENSATNNPIAISKVQGEAKVAVLNGTWTSGLAAKTAANLQKYGFKINETANAPTREYKNSVIYDLTYGQKLQSLEILQAASQATLAYDAPTWLETYKNIPDKPDFILIIGAKQQ